ncbi:MAG TPA: LysM peptidoglycan-binding domain-containing protein [Clostridiaceae bacterium]|nr:LysM peptidoglycan-binding domain-containing protein [Clostridiaceae bacterium]
MISSKKLKVFIAALSLTLMIPNFASAATYTVQSGDSLYKISKLFGTTVDAIKKSNGLSGDTIYPGQKLNVSSEVYTVKSGDTMYLIAKKYGVPLDSLIKANNGLSDMIYPGQKIVIPAAGTTASQQATTTQKSDTTSRGSSRPVISYTASDLDLLARLVRAEAENQPYNAKVAVAAVVVNRVKSSEFANTISGVIYEKIGGYYQFTPVENGWINRPATQECIKAAEDALYGADPSNGALFYFDDSATNKWLWSKPIRARIGNMVYVY